MPESPESIPLRIHLIKQLNDQNDYTNITKSKGSFMKLTINLLLILLIALPAYTQQTGAITGKVVDAKTKQPLVGANVVILDTDRGAATDLQGNYVI